MNTYIQDKLDEITRKYTNNIVLSLGLPYEMITYIENTINANIKQSLTDYHNHIVEKIEEYANSQTDKTVAMGIIGTISLLKD